MNDETRNQIALVRFKLISPVLAEPGRVQNEFFRTLSRQELHFPHYGPRSVAVSTFKRWLRLYRKKGYEALMPKARTDMGRPRKMVDAQMAALRGKCKAYPHWTVKKIYEDLLEAGQLGDPRSATTRF